MSISGGETVSEGILFVLSGPSGVGKGTVLDRLFETYNGINYSVSMTTREPRQGEVEGKDYFFVSEEEFTEIMDRDGFLETARVHGNYYGTPRSYVEETLAKGEDIILEIDIQGANQIRDIFPEAVFIFLKPPSLEALSRRLDKRGTESRKSREIRLENAKAEMAEADKFDHVVLNDKLDNAVVKLKAIIEREKERRK